MWLRTIWYILTLRCEEADRLRSIRRNGELARHQRVAERNHRSLCAGCRRAARQLELIDEGLRGLRGEAPHPHPEWDADRRARLESAFMDEQNGPEPEPGSAPGRDAD